MDGQPLVIVSITLLIMMNTLLVPLVLKILHFLQV